jgi:hypothetical protein
MPPAYVKRQKNDAADAEAICEAVGRPNMRFVETKTAQQQGCPTVHRSRHCSFASMHAGVRASSMGAAIPTEREIFGNGNRG